MRSSSSSRARMSDQTQIISYFKSASQSFNSFKFNAFISSFCSTSRICFSINRNAETSQSSKASKSVKQFKSLKFDVFISCLSSTLRLYLSINDKSITSSQTANHIADLLQVLRVLLEQWADAFVASNNNQWADVFVVSINDISFSSSSSYEFMYSRRNDAERERRIVWRSCLE